MTESTPVHRSRGMEIDAPTRDAVRRFNRRLKFLPRFKIRNRFTPMLINSLMRVSQIGAERRMAQAGITVRTLAVDNGGVRVPLRVLQGQQAVRAVLLDIHGGGWVVGNPRMNDVQNAATVKACEVAVVSIDYRLLPRVPLQAAMDDCLAAARSLLSGGLPEFAGLPVFIVGESAGAHLAATVLLRLKDEPALLAAVKGAVLYYGVYDLGGTPSLRAATSDTLVLDGPGLASALGMLLPECDEQQRRAAHYSPLYADLTGMPPALMFGGTCDPLIDDTVLMALRWSEAAEVEVHVIEDAPHGYLHFPSPLAQLIPARTHAWLRERLGHVD